MEHILAQRQCVPCQGNILPLRGAQLERLTRELGGGWRMAGEHHLEREFLFRDFREALAFTNQVGALAEEQGHHPDIALSYGKVRVSIWTHKIDGLHENDFILAAKISRLFEAFSGKQGSGV